MRRMATPDEMKLDSDVGRRSRAHTGRARASAPRSTEAAPHARRVKRETKNAGDVERRLDVRQAEVASRQECQAPVPRNARGRRRRRRARGSPEESRQGVQDDVVVKRSAQSAARVPSADTFDSRDQGPWRQGWNPFERANDKVVRYWFGCCDAS